MASLICSIVLLFLPVHAGFKFLFISVIAVTSVYFIRRHAWLSLAKSITHLSFNSDSGLHLAFNDGTRLEAKVLEHSFVAAYLTVLNMQALESGKRISIILLPDNTEPGSFRQLRVWLRWGREPLRGAGDLS